MHSLRHGASSMTHRTFDFFHWATAPRCQYYMLQRTFDFLYLTEGKQKQKMGNIPFIKKNKTHRVGRVEEVRLSSGGSRYKLDRGWDSGPHRGWEFFIVVWDGATVIGSVLSNGNTSKHCVLFVFFFSNPG